MVNSADSYSALSSPRPYNQRLSSPGAFMTRVASEVGSLATVIEGKRSSSLSQENCNWSLFSRAAVICQFSSQSPRMKSKLSELSL